MAPGYTLLILTGILVSVVSAADFQKQEIYNNCGGNSKICYGDVEGCVESKNCTYVVTLSQNATDYIAEIQNNCNLAENSVFFGVGVHALVKEGPNVSPKYTCTPKFEDFKFVILWEGEKCVKEGVIQKKWGNMKKTLVDPCQSSPKVENLLDFVKKNMLVQAGPIPTSLIENEDYVEKNGAFFSNSGSFLSLSLICTIIAMVAFITPPCKI